MNEYGNYTHKCYSPFLSSNNHEDVSSGSEYDFSKTKILSPEKHYFGFIIKEIKEF